jgi:hypothetical protein
MSAGQTSHPEGPARRVSFSELLAGPNAASDASRTGAGLGDGLPVAETVDHSAGLVKPALDGVEVIEVVRVVPTEHSIGNMAFSYTEGCRFLSACFDRGKAPLPT